MTTGSASGAAIPLLEDYLTERALRLHQTCGDVLGAAVTLAVDGKPMTVGASAPIVAEVDHAQYEIGVGPCLAALTESIARYVPDLAGDERWAPYGKVAAGMGARSCISVPVVVNDLTMAVVKVYSDQIDGLDEGQQKAAVQAAADLVGGIALAERLVAQADELDQRTAAMDSRRTIDLAIGIMMERLGCDADAAFRLLRVQSQRSNVKLRVAAASVVGTRGEVDGRAPFRSSTDPKPSA